MNVAKCITSPQRGEAYFKCSNCGKVRDCVSIKDAKRYGKEHKQYCKDQRGESK
jgi:hypothetical protein